MSSTRVNQDSEGEGGNDRDDKDRDNKDRDDKDRDDKDRDDKDRDDKDRDDKDRDDRDRDDRDPDDRATPLKTDIRGADDDDRDAIPKSVSIEKLKSELKPGESKDGHRTPPLKPGESKDGRRTPPWKPGESNDGRRTPPWNTMKRADNDDRDRDRDRESDRDRDRDIPRKPMCETDDERGRPLKPQFDDLETDAEPDSFPRRRKGWDDYDDDDPDASDGGMTDRYDDDDDDGRPSAFQRSYNNRSPSPYNTRFGPTGGRMGQQSPPVQYNASSPSSPTINPITAAMFLVGTSVDLMYPLALDALSEVFLLALVVSGLLFGFWFLLNIGINPRLRSERTEWGFLGLRDGAVVYLLSFIPIVRVPLMFAYFANLSYFQ